jgi:hypothetical protein
MIDNWNEAQAVALLGAMRAVAEGDGELSDGEQGLIDAAAQHVFGLGPTPAVEPVTPEELAAALDDGQHQMAVNFLVVMPYADAAISDPEVDVVDDYAKALAFNPKSLADLHKVREGHIKRLLFDYGRRTLKEIGPHQSVFKAITSSIHQYVGDAKLAARYQALEQYPENSLGCAVFNFYRARAFGLPGEKKGFGETVVGHDSSHILSGFNTDGAGEIGVAGFEAGMKRDGFGYELLMEVLLDYQLGIDFGGRAVGFEVKTGELDPELLMVGIERGLACNTDIWGPDWDFWTVADQPVTALRERYGIVGPTDVLLDAPPAPA